MTGGLSLFMWRLHMKEIVCTLLITTYSICLPLLVKWIHQMKVDKQQTKKRMTESVSNIYDKMDKLMDGLCRLNDKTDFNEAMTSRYRIIRAADEIRNSIDLSEEHLEQLGEDIEIYRAYCSTHPDYRNHKGQNSMQLVLEYEEKKLGGAINGY